MAWFFQAQRQDVTHIGVEVTGGIWVSKNQDISLHTARYRAFHWWIPDVLSLRLHARSEVTAPAIPFIANTHMHRVMPDKTSTPAEALHSLRTSSSGYLRGASNPFSFVENINKGVARQARLACSSNRYIKLLDRDKEVSGKYNRKELNVES